MASMLCLCNKSQQSYKSIENKNFAIKAYPKYWAININYPIIAKGNIIEGIEAKW